jgi:hypothetical protein
VLTGNRHDATQSQICRMLHARGDFGYQPDTIYAELASFRLIGPAQSARRAFTPPDLHRLYYA